MFKRPRSVATTSKQGGYWQLTPSLFSSRPKAASAGRVAEWAMVRALSAGTNNPDDANGWNEASMSAAPGGRAKGLGWLASLVPSRKRALPLEACFTPVGVWPHLRRCESMEKEVEHRDKSNKKLCPLSELEVTTACLNMQDQPSFGPPTKGRGDAVSRQTSHGEWKTLSNQGSLEASLGMISRRVLQKQCSSMCVRLLLVRTWGHGSSRRASSSASLTCHCYVQIQDGHGLGYLRSA